MTEKSKEFLQKIGFPVEYLLENPVNNYHPETCEKPNCRCPEIESTKQGGVEVKSYPCLSKCKNNLSEEFKGFM